MTSISCNRIILLIGRYLPETHHVLDQRTGLCYAPFTQKLRRMANRWRALYGQGSVVVNNTYLSDNRRNIVYQPSDILTVKRNGRTLASL